MATLYIVVLENYPLEIFGLEKAPLKQRYSILDAYYKPHSPHLLPSILMAKFPAPSLYNSKINIPHQISAFFKQEKSSITFLYTINLYSTPVLIRLFEGLAWEVLFKS